MIFGINTTCDISKLSQISRAVRITILKYHSWYLCQISLQIMLLPILIYNFTCEITKLPWQPSVRLSGKRATKFYDSTNKDVRVLKDALENLNTKINFKPNLSSKRLREWSSRWIRSRMVNKWYTCEIRE